MTVCAETKATQQPYSSNRLLIMDMDSLFKVLGTLSLSQLNQCSEHLEKIIRFKRQTATSLCVSNFVESHSDFVDKTSVEHKTILSELEAIQFNSPGDKTVTKWLTSTGEQYSWSSSNGRPTVKDPIDISKYPGINGLMNNINTKFGCKLNSCLASYYKTGKSSTRYHSDDETSLDRSQGLYIVSFGAERSIDFHSQENDKRHKAEYSIKTPDCSLYIMKPGCQDFFAHRVRSNPSSKQPRYSLSFRCMLPKASGQDVDASVKTGSDSEHKETAQDASVLSFCTPTPEQLVTQSKSLKPKKRRTTVLFGTSMTKFIRTNKLGFRGRKVLNLSQSGAKIVDIKDNVKNFYSSNEAAKSDDVEKIIFSLGTNDVKYCKFGVKHLSRYLADLIDTTKLLFPHAVISFHSCLPIRGMYSYIAKNVVEFNNLLRDLCFTMNCIYVDCFKDFLTHDFRYANHDLYHDWLHLNNRGLGVLSTWIKYFVNEVGFQYRIVDNIVGL